MKKYKILIDGDILLCKIGFACQRTCYLIREDGHTYDCEDSWTLRDIKKIIEEECIRPEVLRYFKTAPDQVKFTARELVGSILKNIGSDDYIIFLKHPGTKTFRHQIDPSYKTSRLNYPRPVLEQQAREYLVDNYNVQFVSGIEVDDMLGIEQDKVNNSTIIASIDKDLWQVPGMHYNINTREIGYSYDPGYLCYHPKNSSTLYGRGKLWFWAQMLLGDSTDDIKGLNKYGSKDYSNKKVFQLLTSSLDNVEDLVYTQYQKVLKDRADEIFKLNKQLLWILRDFKEVPGNITGV